MLSRLDKPPALIHNSPMRTPLWTYSLHSFGCKVNQYESQALKDAWAAQGGQECPDPAQADWIIFNTCAITAKAENTCRHAVQRLHAAAPGTPLVITGCAASVSREALLALPGVRAVITQQEKALLLEGPPFAGTSEASAVKTDTFPPFSVHSFSRTRPVIKVQDGCSRMCAYCIVPTTRGKPLSRSVDAILAEARTLLGLGHRELMLSGINLLQYHTPDAKTFWDMLARVDAALAPEWQGRARLRISSLDPSQLGSRGLDCLANTRMVCPHIHLSLQNGSMDVLRRMNRAHYSPEFVLRSVEKLGDFWPLFGLGADIIMGFPGEEANDVDESLALLRTLPLSYAHVFPFSARPGTKAATMADQLPPKEKQARIAIVRALVEEKRVQFLQQLLAQGLCVVAPEGSRGKGMNEYYVPCAISGTKANGLELAPARILRMEDRHLVVTLA